MGSTWLKVLKLCRPHTDSLIINLVSDVVHLHDKDLITVQDLDRASSGWDLLFEYHGRPSGIYSADEYLAGLGAARG